MNHTLAERKSRKKRKLMLQNTNGGGHKKALIKSEFVEIIPGGALAMA